MSKRGIAVVLLAASCLATAGSARAEPAQTVDYFGKPWVWSPSVYFSAGAVDFKRGNPTSGAIVASNPGTATAFLSGTDYNFGWHGGWDATFGFRFFQADAVEVRFLDIATTSATFDMRTPGAFIGIGFTGPTNTLFQTQYNTKLTSWEVNWRHQVFGDGIPVLDQLHVLAGVRSIHVSDVLSGQINGTVASAIYNYDNQLLGLQIGADVGLLPKTWPVQVNAFGKIGRYHLDTSGGIFEYQGANNTFIGSFSTQQTDRVTAREVGISAGWRPWQNVLLRAGYQALWIDNIGLASANAAQSLTNPALLNSNVFRENLFFQGINFGLTISQ
ncbi:MAG TPA: hypothetical protein VFW22_01215 [Pseudolabrys sp.]|nr:hypothetical protein [Pseudolabrys sp.]